MQKILPPSAILVPDNAERVFKGAIFDAYQWPQKMFDDRTATFEMLKRPDTVQILLVRDGQILLVNDEQPGRSTRLHVPGGRADEEDVSWVEAAQRELREETGMVCKNWRLVDVGQPLIKIEWFTPLFLASDITAELPQQLDPGGEKITFQWLGFDEVRALILSGDEPTLAYLLSLFSRVKTIEQLMALPVYEGQAVDR